MNRNHRRFVARCLTAAYVIPYVLTLSGALGHGAYHAVESLRAGHAKVLATGLVHTIPGEARSSSQGGEPEFRFVHEHDGSRHTHTSRVNVLVAASEETGEGTGEAQAPLELLAHVPVSGPASLKVRLALLDVQRLELDEPEHLSFPPPTDPPKA